MTDHDQLFKLLLQTFFREFLEAFVPEICDSLKPASIHFLDKELIRMQGAKRDTKLVDLVARVRLAGQDGFVLVHLEHQAQRERDVGRRMFLYAAWLIQRYGLPVYPVLLASYAQPHEPEPACYRMDVRGFRVLEFHYHVVQLNRLHWRAYARLKNPAATALMVKMRISPEDRVKVKLQVLRLMATLRLDPGKMNLIAGFMESYLVLTAKEELAFQQALNRIQDSREKESVMELMTSWERKGRQEGRQEGQSATIKRQLRVLTGRLTPTLAREIDRLGESQLAELAEALLGFSGARDLDRWLREHRG